MPGGALTIAWAPGEPIRMRGAATHVFKGEIDLEALAMSVETITLGCRLNFAESEAMARAAPAGEDWIIVNSCAVTNEAVRQTRQAIRRAHRERPDARILVTGCAAQLEPERFRARCPRSTAGRGLRDFAAPLTVAAGLPARVRSFVAVQTGCDHRCTFCTIWQARGPSRSLPFEAVRDAVERELDARREGDRPHRRRHHRATKAASARCASGCSPTCPRLKRLRLSSLDSIEIDDALFELIAGEPRLMPHFHLSLQAGDDLILKRMKRRHSRADAVRDWSSGSRRRGPTRRSAPTSSPAFPPKPKKWRSTRCALLDDCDIVAAHIFPFSPRPDTPAARMPQLERETGQGPRGAAARGGGGAALALARQPGRHRPARADRE